MFPGALFALSLLNPEGGNVLRCNGGPQETRQKGKLSNCTTLSKQVGT